MIHEVFVFREPSRRYLQTAYPSNPQYTREYVHHLLAITIKLG